MVPVLSAGLGLGDAATLEASRAADSILESGVTKTQKASFYVKGFEKKRHVCSEQRDGVLPDRQTSRLSAVPRLS